MGKKSLKIGDVVRSSAFVYADSHRSDNLLSVANPRYPFRSSQQYDDITRKNALWLVTGTHEDRYHDAHLNRTDPHGIMVFIVTRIEDDGRCYTNSEQLEFTFEGGRTFSIAPSRVTIVSGREILCSNRPRYSKKRESRKRT